MNSKLESLKQRLEDAANRALHSSDEVRAIVEGAREAGYDVDASLVIDVIRRVDEAWLESLYRLEDRRTR